MPDGLAVPMSRLMPTSRAPVALFVYGRRDLASRTVEALAANPEASQTDLIVFSDGARGERDAAKVAAVRDYIVGIRGFRSMRVVNGSENRGLARSIIGGVTQVTAECGRVIVMEDDLLTSRHFLAYMNDALDRYAEEPRVAAVSGYHPPFDIPMPDTFFQRDAECWGWGTWQRAWAHFNPDGAALLAQIRAGKLERQFDQDGSTSYVRMLEDQIAGRNNSWAIRWRASVFLKDLLSVYPARPLTNNIGFDGSGTHCEVSDVWGTEVSAMPIPVGQVPVVHSDAAYQAFVRFNRNQVPTFGQRVSRKLKRLIKAR